MHGCCSFGAHFLDEKDFKNVTKYVKRLKGRHWKNKDKAKDKGWFSTEKDGEKKTRRVKPEKDEDRGGAKDIVDGFFAEPEAKEPAGAFDAEFAFPIAQQPRLDLEN
jgi:hypothetical protein